MRRIRYTNLFTVLGVGVFMVVVLVGVMFFGHIWTTGSNYHVSVYVENARGIANDSTVFEAGLPVGQVTGIDRKGPDAILTLRIRAGMRPLPVNTTVQVGLRSLAGESDVQLTPGNSTQKVKNNGSLGLSQDQDYTEVDQILNAFQGQTQPATRKFFQAAGYAINGEGTNFNQVLGNFAALVNDSPPLTSTLAHQDGQVADIVQNFGDIMQAIGQRNTVLKQFATGALTTFNIVSARDLELDAVLKQLPLALRGGRSATHQAGVAESTVVPVVNHLAQAITDLSPAIDALSPASTNGIKLIQSLGNASPALKNLLVNLTELQPSASKALPALHAVTCQLDPMVRFIEPYGNEIAGFFENFGGATDAYAQSSHELLTTAVVDPTHIFRGITNPGLDSALNTLITAGIFQKAGAHTGFDPEPVVGGENATNVGVGITGATAWAQAHPNSYPHVTEDCPVPAGDQPDVPKAPTS